MKEKYLARLKEELEDRGIYDNALVISKYERRYNLGKEAGLTDFEIEEMLGTPTEVAEKIYIDNMNNESSKYAEETYENFKATISTVSDNITIVFDDIDKPYYEVNNVDLNNYNIINNPDEFKFAFIKMKFLALYRTVGNIKIYLPYSHMNSIAINSTSGNITIENNAISKYFTLETISGNVKTDNIESQEMNIKTVSGNVSCKTLVATNAFCSTVSGDYSVEFVKSNVLNLESISGSIIIKEADSSINATSISGNIMVNDKEIGHSIKNKFKDFFK